MFVNYFWKFCCVGNVVVLLGWCWSWLVWWWVYWFWWVYGIFVVSGIVEICVDGWVFLFSWLYLDFVWWLWCVFCYLGLFGFGWYLMRFDDWYSLVRCIICCLIEILSRGCCLLVLWLLVFDLVVVWNDWLMSIGWLGYWELIEVLLWC